MTQTALNQISDHVFWLAPDSTTDRPTLGAIVGTQGTLMVDAGNSPAHADLFLAELTKRGLAKPNHVVITHWHWDHVFGASALDAPLFAHDETQRAMLEMVNLDWSDAALDQRVEDGTEIEFCRDMIKAELPDRSDLVLRSADVSFANRLEFDLGGVTCQVVHVGGDHASDSTVVFVPEDRILFLSDCLYVNLHQGPHNYTVDKLFPLLDKIMSFDAEHYLWGHNDEPMSRSEMEIFLELLRTIEDLVRKHDGHREDIMQALQEMPKPQIDEDPVELADAFLAGLKVL